MGQQSAADLWHTTLPLWGDVTRPRDIHAGFLWTRPVILRIYIPVHLHLRFIAKKNLSNTVMLSRDGCRSHLQNLIHFGQSAGLTSCNTLTRYGYSFNSRVAQCVDLMLVPIRLAALRIEECGVSEKAAPISSTFSGVNTVCVWFFDAFITLPISRNFFTSWEIDDLFRICVFILGSKRGDRVSIWFRC